MKAPVDLLNILSDYVYTELKKGVKILGGHMQVLLVKFDNLNDHTLRFLGLTFVRVIKLLFRVELKVTLTAPTL